MSKRKTEAEVLRDGWSAEDAQWSDAWDRTPSLSGFSAGQVRIYQLGHYRGWMSSISTPPPQVSTPQTTELTESEKVLWMEEYRRCRDNGCTVETACTVADNAVKEISKRMGRQEEAEMVASCADDVVLPDGVFWDGGTLRFSRHIGDRELMGEVDGDFWYAYPRDDNDGRTKKGPINTKDDDYYQRGKLMVLRSIDWASYGLKRPEGL